MLYYIDMDKNYYIADGEYSKRGYLLNCFEVFSIKDKIDEKFEFHYHDFCKLILFKSGDVKYNIEGKEYQLLPDDILLVGQGDIHRPIINASQYYDRIIIWIDSDYLKSINLMTAFDMVKERGFNLIRSADNKIFSAAHKLAIAEKNDFAYEQYKEALLTELLILITRSIIDSDTEAIGYKSDKQIDDIIKFINNNLDKPLSIECIAERFYISRYHLMHKFKEHTGKTIYSYIQSKRLLKACEYMNQGMIIKEACFACGFNDYSVFLKAFKKEFNTTPAKYRQ